MMKFFLHIEVFIHGSRIQHVCCGCFIVFLFPVVSLLIMCLALPYYLLTNVTCSNVRVTKNSVTFCQLSEVQNRLDQQAWLCNYIWSTRQMIFPV